VPEPPNLSVVIPAWNERENLEVLLPILTATLQNLDARAEILVVDARSDEGSKAVVERFGARYVVQHERGYGGALLTGFAEAAAPYIVTMDADLSHPPLFLHEFWAKRDSAEMLIGSLCWAAANSICAAAVRHNKRVVTHQRGAAHLTIALDQGARLGARQLRADMGGGKFGSEHK